MLPLYFRFSPLFYSPPFPLDARAQAATVFTVNSTQDQPDTMPGDGQCFTGDSAPNTSGRHDECTLRAAVDEANATAGAVVINLPGQLAGGNSGTYTLNRISESNQLHDDANDYGDIDIGAGSALFTKLTIRGTGTPGPTVNTSKIDRIFDVVSATPDSVIFERLNVTGGTARKGANGNADGSGAQGVDGEDGADGGGLRIAVDIGVRIDQSTFSGNATQSGGNGAVPATSLERDEGGAAGDGGDGGAIYNEGDLIVRRSTFSGNSTGDGASPGSGQDDGDADNTAKGGDGGDGGNGGAIFNAGTLEIEESTVVDNAGGDPSQGASGINASSEDGATGQGGSGGGIANAEQTEAEDSDPTLQNLGTASLRNNIIASNVAGDDPTDGGASDPPKQPGSDLFDASDGGTYTTPMYNIVGSNNSVSTTFPNTVNDNSSYDTSNNIVGTGQQQATSRIQPKLGSLNNNDDEATPTRSALSNSPERYEHRPRRQHDPRGPARLSAPHRRQRRRHRHGGHGGVRGRLATHARRPRHQRGGRRHDQRRRGVHRAEEHRRLRRATRRLRARVLRRRRRPELLFDERAR